MDEKDEVKDAKKILIDGNVCIGCGTCEGIASEYFKVEDGIAEVAAPYKEEDADLIDEAISSCPVSAISVSE